MKDVTVDELERIIREALQEAGIEVKRWETERFIAQFIYDELHPTAQEVDVVLPAA